MKVKEKLRFKNKLYKKKIKKILECDNINNILQNVEDPYIIDEAFFSPNIDSYIETPTFSDINEPVIYSKIVDEERKTKIFEIENVACDKFAKFKNSKRKNSDSNKNQLSASRQTSKGVHSQFTSQLENSMIDTISSIVASEDRSTISNKIVELNGDLLNNGADLLRASSIKHNLSYNFHMDELKRNGEDFKTSKHIGNLDERLPLKKNKTTKHKDKLFCNQTIKQNIIKNNDLFFSVKSNRNKNLCTKNIKETFKLSTESKVPQILLNADFTSYKEDNKINYQHSVLELFDKTPVSKNVSFHTVEENVSDIKNSEIDNITDTMVNENHFDIINNFESVKNADFVDKSQLLEETSLSEKVSQNNFKLYEGPNYCLLVLKESSKVYFCGKLQASLLYGKVKVLGYSLNENFQELYSANGFSLLAFESFSHNGDLEDLHRKMIRYNTPLSMISDVFNCIVKGDALLILKPHNNVMTKFISKHLSDTDMFSNAKNTVSKDNNFSKILQSNFYVGDCCNILVMNKTWDDIVDSIVFRLSESLSNIVLLCGGKNVGKSTMLRYITNSILNYGPVAVIDLDPGQPEFTVCGVISVTIVDSPLLGPNFTHTKQPEKSYSVGLINVMENIDRYMNALIKLADFFNNSIDSVRMPCIINTMGFTDSSGLELLMETLNIFKPTAVVQIEAASIKNNFHMDITSENVNKFQNDFQAGKSYENMTYNYAYYKCAPYQQLWKNIDKHFISRNINAKTERLLNVLSYFSKMTSSECLSLLNVIPYFISLKEVRVAMNSIIIQDSHVANVLNGRLVTLCVEDILENNVSGVYKLPTNSVVESVGFGLVRGVDIVNKTLYVLTPVHKNSLQQVNLLLYMETLPDCSNIFSIPHLPCNTFIPYTASQKENVKHKNLHEIPKRKFNAVRLLEIARKC